MTVCDIVDQFTHKNFDLIVYDLDTGYELYSGPASAVFSNDVGTYTVVSIEPPEAPREVILNVNSSDNESYEFIIDELEEI